MDQSTKPAPDFIQTEDRVLRTNGSYVKQRESYDNDMHTAAILREIYFYERIAPQIIPHLDGFAYSLTQKVNFFAQISMPTRIGRRSEIPKGFEMKNYGVDFKDLIYDRSYDVRTHTALSILLKSAITLEGLHQCGILFGDFKPEQVIYNIGTRLVHLIDFETVRIQSPYGFHLPLAVSRTEIKLTPRYTSPEMYKYYLSHNPSKDNTLIRAVVKNRFETVLSSNQQQSYKKLLEVPDSEFSFNSDTYAFAAQVLFINLLNSSIKVPDNLKRLAIETVLSKKEDRPSMNDFIEVLISRVL